MPLRAVDAEGTSWHSFIGAHVEHIKAQAPGTFLCPHCGARMGFRPEGKRKGVFKVAAYFFHIIRQCASTAARHRESEEHTTAKLLVIERLQAFHPGYRDGEVEWQTEVHIPECNRIADVLCTFPDGRRVAHEVQLSPQSQHDFIQRTDDYASAGVEVMWWLGPRLRQHEDWCLENLGVVGYVDVEYDDNYTNLGDNKGRAA